ncbi:hypothetical protein M0805_007932 [Coniferiporia weirii]|nr:hypothetical protein M0805_007932 [Coniferiporia weirii]
MSSLPHKERRNQTRVFTWNEIQQPATNGPESSSESSSDDEESGNMGYGMRSPSKLSPREGRVNVTKSRNALTFSSETSDVITKLKDFVGTCGGLESFLSDFAHRVQKINSTLTLVDASRRLARTLSGAREHFTVRLFEKQGTETSSVPTSAGTVFASVPASLLGDIADAVVDFNSAIVDFEDFFPDEKGYKALEEFQYELSVLANSLEYFGTDKNTVHMSEFVAARTKLLKADLEETHTFLKRFKKRGILCISYAQERSSKMTSDAATVATFFAGVAATVIQYSIVDVTSARGIAVNTLWFSSLALSAGSAISAMLALSWRSAVFSRPKRRLSWYIRFWIRSGYLILLIASVVAFLGGLVMFVFDSQPSKITFWVMVGITVFCMIGLASVTCVFIKGRIDMIRLRRQARKGRKLSEGWLSHLDHVLRQLHRMKGKIFMKTTTPKFSRKRKEQSSLFSRVLNAILFFRSEVELRYYQIRDPEAGTNEKDMEENLMLRVAMGQLAPLRGNVLEPAQSQLSLPEVCDTYPVLSPQELFSPGGQQLVVCYKYSCRVYDTENSFKYIKALPHSTRRRIRQVEWAPDSKHLVTRLSKGVRIWTVNGKDNFTSEKVTRLLNSDLTDVKWLNNDEFLAVTNGEMLRVNVASNTEASIVIYKDGLSDRNLELHYLYTIQESEFVVIVATCKFKELPEEKAIDCVLVYKMGMYNHGEAQFQTSGRTFVRYLPLSDAYKSLSIGPWVGQEENRLRYMLIGYKTKLPEIWTINVNTGEISLKERLKLQPKEKLDTKMECGDAFFIGLKQEIIACVGGGMMHFWHLETLQHFHKLKIVDEEGDVEELPIFTWTACPLRLTMVTAHEGSPPKIWGPGKEDKRADEGMERHGPEGEPEIIASPGPDGPQFVDPEAGTQVPYVPDSTNFATPQHEVAQPSGDTPLVQSKLYNGR